MQEPTAVFISENAFEKFMDKDFQELRPVVNKAFNSLFLMTLRSPVIRFF